MLIQGTISQVQEPDYTDPKYGNQYQNIKIDTINGAFIGRIGSKKPYTQADIGSDGQWDTGPGTSAQGPYNKLKKHFDTPYGQQGQPQAPQQRNDKPDWAAIALGKVRHGIVCAFLQAGTEPAIPRVEYWVQYVMTGKAPLPPEQAGISYEVDEDKAPF